MRYKTGNIHRRKKVKREIWKLLIENAFPPVWRICQTPCRPWVCVFHCAPIHTAMLLCYYLSFILPLSHGRNDSPFRHRVKNVQCLSTVDDGPIRVYNSLWSIYTGSFCVSLARTVLRSNWQLSSLAPLVANPCRSVYIAQNMASEGVCHTCWTGKWSIVERNIIWG